jgi:hypothetical protein
MANCRYSIPEIRYSCPFEAEKGEEYCIFHLPKEKKEPKEFWKHLANYLIALMENTDKKKIKDFLNRGEAWIFQEKEDSLLNYYRGKVKKGESWQFIGFVFLEMDKEHNFIGFPFWNANFRLAQFSGNAYFSRAQFSGNAYFIEAQFSGNAYFRLTQFSGYAGFRRAQFFGNAGFILAQFSGNASFIWVQFSGNASFIWAQFSGDTYFSGSKFSGNAYFIGAKFSGYADFSLAKFSGYANFAFARFLKKTDFHSSKVNLLNFTSCEIFSFLRLREIKQIKGNSDPPIILLRDLRFWENGHILLEDFAPSGISFLHTNFHIVHPRIYLIRMDWGKEKIILDDIFKRKIKAEKEEERSKWEIVYKPIEKMSEEKKVEEIERCYRQIRLAYEAMGEYPDAGDFYLQEMRIRGKRLKGIIKILHCLYGWVSKYGESPARAFYWLIGIWLGSAFLYFFTGFNFFGYNVIHLPKFALSKIQILWIRDLLAILFALINLIPGYFRFITQPQTNPLLTTIISIIEGFLGIIVLTLFLLAIRRRFKR